MDDGFLTVAEVAVELGKSEQTVRQWIREGRLPAITVGLRGYRVSGSDLERMISYSPGNAGDAQATQQSAQRPPSEPAKFTEEDLGAELLARTRAPHD